MHWQTDLIEAYVRAGQPDVAAEQLAVLERARDCRWARGTAARCRGLLAGEDERDAWFATALRELHALRAPFEIARTHLCQLEAYFQVPTGEWVKAQKDLDVLRDLAVAGIKTREPYTFPNGTYTLAIVRGDEVLDEASVSLCER